MSNVEITHSLADRSDVWLIREISRLIGEAHPAYCLICELRRRLYVLRSREMIYHVEDTLSAPREVPK